MWANTHELMIKVKQNAFPKLAIGALLAVFSLYGCSSGTEQSQAPAEDAFNKYYDGKGVGPITEYAIGTADVTQRVDSGQKVFETKCTSCHKLTAERAIGPGLLGITKIRRPEWIMNQILNPMEMTQKDSMAQALLKKYTTQMINMNLTEGEAGAVYEYLKKNDGGAQ